MSYKIQNVRTFRLARAHSILKQFSENCISSCKIQDEMIENSTKSQEKEILNTFVQKTNVLKIAILFGKHHDPFEFVIILEI